MLTDLSQEFGVTDEYAQTAEADHVQLVSFMVRERVFAVEILVVREIRQPSHLTKLPNQPEEVRGVLNLRGSIVPVHDLAIRFSGAPIIVEDLTVIVIAQVGERVLGMMVDTVLDILMVARDDIRPMPPGSDVPVVAGLIETSDGTITLLDLEEVFPQAVEPETASS